jgi:thymidylate synthase (FAD)
MSLTTPVLDHGFVTLRNLAGPTRRNRTDPDEHGVDWVREFDADDRDPAQAARMSFDVTEERTAEEDFRLSRYLMKNWHTSPFEMVECWFEMKMPIFVARQFVRHRTVSINEVSGRYVTLPGEWYIPEIVGGKAPSAKQGQEDNLSAEAQRAFKQDLDRQCRQGYKLYTDHISDGVAAEHARLLLHLNHYTHWLWKQDLHNMMNFLRLRDHFHAQIEAQSYAKAVDGHLRTYLPKSMELYDEYRRLRVVA